MPKVCQIGFGLSAALIIAATMLGRTGFAAAAGDASEDASVLQRIFVNLSAKGVDMPFGGPIAASLGIVQRGKTVEVSELPPVKTNAGDVVHIFFQLENGSGYIVARFTASGIVAFLFDRNFEFVAAAIQRNGQPAAKLSGVAVANMLSQEIGDCKIIASRLANHP